MRKNDKELWESYIIWFRALVGRAPYDTPSEDMYWHAYQAGYYDNYDSVEDF